MKKIGILLVLLSAISLASYEEVNANFNRHGNMSTLKKRTAALNAEDTSKAVRKSHENPYIKKLYAEHLDKPMSHEAHELLHTKYFKKHKI